MSWFGQKKRSPKATASGSGVLSSAGVENAIAAGSWLEGDGKGLHNPLAWDSVPSALREKFPHWKENSPAGQRTHPQSSNQEPEQTYSCYKTTYNIKQQPDCTFLYVVMEHDTLNSIAVKFETTPAELARLNKKPLGPTSTIFTGEVLYVPDHDEMARSAPKPTPPTPHPLSSSDQFHSSVESEGTIRSSSVSQPEPEPPEEDNQVEEGGGSPVMRDEKYFEEVTDTHMVLVSRYISDDQGCAHGNLMINLTAIMFTPFPTEPLVKEHGSAHFEIMVPLQDIIFAAFTKDINPPKRKKAVTMFGTAETSSSGSIQQSSGQSVKEEEEEGQVRSDGESEEEQLKSPESELEPKAALSPERVSNSSSQISSEDGFHKQHSTDELLAIMGADTVNHRKTPSHTVSESSSVDSLLSEHPCFLHIRVSHKCSATHTYTPLNRAVGIDIPQNLLSPPKGTVQLVKTVFCFAVAERRMMDLASFISKHHPGIGRDAQRPLSCPPSGWAEESYEFISYEDPTHEDLNFSDDYFKGAESSESWEVYSLKDVTKYRQKIDKMEVEAGLPLPVLSEKSSLMEEQHLRALANNILSAAVGHDWFLVYSTFKHGISLRTLYRNMVTCGLPESPVVLLVRDEQHKLFGAALTSPLKLSDKYYGTGESYLFSFDSPTDIKIFPWTGENNYIVKGSSDSISVGCEDGHSGLWLDESLLSGSSEGCSTFGNTCLSSKPEFACSGLEAWGFL